MYLIYAWLAFLAFCFVILWAMDKKDMSEARKTRVTFSFVGLTSNITALLIFLASR